MSKQWRYCANHNITIKFKPNNRCISRPPECFRITYLCELELVNSSYSFTGISSASRNFVCFKEFRLLQGSVEVPGRALLPSSWEAGLGLIYWLSRMWIKTARGEMHDDPVVYAMKDRISRVMVVLMVAVTLIAHYIPFPYWLWIRLFSQLCVLPFQLRLISF